MGYRCPVCGDPQADDVHLANHLAFTAIARGGEHEAWLDETVPEWGQLDDDGLAEAVTPHAEEEEYPRMFEDTTEQGHEHDDGTGHESEVSGAVPDRPVDDPEVREIVERARELTRERQRSSDATGADNED